MPVIVADTQRTAGGDVIARNQGISSGITVAGAVANIGLSAPTFTASGSAAAMGNPGAIGLTAPTGSATGSTTGAGAVCTFDGAAQRIILTGTNVNVIDIYAAWVAWAVSNGGFSAALRSVGGDDLGGGQTIPIYFFLLNGWRIRPMEASQTLTLTGNVFVDGGGEPLVPTLGAFSVLALRVATVGGYSPAAIANQVRAELALEMSRLDAKVSSRSTLAHIAAFSQ